jgi:hypothetical protein
VKVSVGDGKIASVGKGGSVRGAQAANNKNPKSNIILTILSHPTCNIS